jgi:hypothetical protein
MRIVRRLCRAAEMRPKTAEAAPIILNLLIFVVLEVVGAEAPKSKMADRSARLCPVE